MTGTDTLPDRLERVLKRVAGIFAIIAGIALVGLCGLTVVSVFYRYALRNPIHGVEDLSTMALAVLVAGSIAWAASVQGHVAVNILPAVMGRAASRFTDLFARLLTAAMLLIAAWALVVKGSCGMACGAFTPNTGILHMPFYFALAAALLLYGLMVLVHVAIGLRHWTGRDPNEVRD